MTQKNLKTDLKTDLKTGNFDALYRTHYPRIYRFLYRLTQSGDEAEDLAQETFVKLYRCLDKATPPENPTAWLFKVAANACYSHLRQTRRRRELVADERSHLHFPPGPSAVGSVEDEFMEKEKRSRIRWAMEKLPLKDRMILELFQTGLPYDDIARILELKPSSVGKKLFRARKKLVRELKTGDAL